MSAAEKLGVLPLAEAENGLLKNCFVEIYDNGVVLTGKDTTLTINNCNVIARAGEDMPEIAPGQIAVHVPPEPPREWTQDDWEEFLRDQFGEPF